mmetsp:Transcript_15578/g.43043  ORF Transcript_15578/g.43043 Transcript_15578/m.43043 type:complete len:240 (-) Transcript_15578:57-776(-)
MVTGHLALSMAVPCRDGECQSFASANCRTSGAHVVGALRVGAPPMRAAVVVPPVLVLLGMVRQRSRPTATEASVVSAPMMSEGLQTLPHGQRCPGAHQPPQSRHSRRLQRSVRQPPLACRRSAGPPGYHSLRCRSSRDGLQPSRPQGLPPRSARPTFSAAACCVAAWDPASATTGPQRRAPAQRSPLRKAPRAVRLRSAPAVAMVLAARRHHRSRGSRWPLEGVLNCSSSDRTHRFSEP